MHVRAYDQAAVRLRSGGASLSSGTDGMNMEHRCNMQDGPGRVSLGLVAAILCFPTLAWADAGGATGVGPSDAIIQGAPSVKGFVNDGDETVVETVMLYMNGCPVVSITPPEGGRGMPVVTAIEQTGACVAGKGTQDPAILEARGDSGMHVQLWTDAQAETPDASTLVIEVSSLYPDALSPETVARGIAPLFDIPGLFGDPSGDLMLAAGEGGGGGGLWGSGESTGWPGGAGGGGGTGAGGGTPVPGGGFLNTAPDGGTTSVPPIAAVPLPATLLLLLWALQMLRSYVRRT